MLKCKRIIRVDTFKMMMRWSASYRLETDLLRHYPNRSRMSQEFDSKVVWLIVTYAKEAQQS
jgi:hypothetical protein